MRKKTFKDLREFGEWLDKALEKQNIITNDCLINYGDFDCWNKSGSTLSFDNLWFKVTNPTMAKKLIDFKEYLIKTCDIKILNIDITIN
ncbi:hypothetical protein N2W52_002064 [Clostridium perfringens]|nr:hypothetical protein [Clostridium perfringens]MDK0983081.1 hypothetical protein [Clostridium perfringens]